MPPNHPNHLEEVRKNVLHQERLILECDFDGHPTPRLTWIRGIEPVPEFSDDLFLTDANHTLVSHLFVCWSYLSLPHVIIIFL